MSRGEGLLQRSIMRLVEEAARRGDPPLTRRDLEGRLGPEGYRSDNILRSVRGLARAGKVEYLERRFASNCAVRPPRPFKPFSDEEIMRMLEEPRLEPDRRRSQASPPSPAAHPGHPPPPQRKKHPEYARRRLNHG